MIMEKNNSSEYNIFRSSSVKRIKRLKTWIQLYVDAKNSRSASTRKDQGLNSVSVEVLLFFIDVWFFVIALELVLSKPNLVPC
jgi:hypothetical protein